MYGYCFCDHQCNIICLYPIFYYYILYLIKSAAVLGPGDNIILYVSSTHDSIVQILWRNAKNAVNVAVVGTTCTVAAVAVLQGVVIMLL